MYHIIMAGGAGTRFWPLSREKTPKQFLSLTDNKSFIQKTYDRLLQVSNPDKIFILASKKYKKNILNQFPNINPKNLIFEPSPKNTAPAIYLACSYILNIDSNAILGIYPSDHHIENENEFIDSINKANEHIVENHKAIITLGIKPQYPSTSYGYINIDNNNSYLNDIFKVKSFLEKPDLDTAKKMIKNKNIFWNSGMFFFKAKSMVNEIEQFAPKIKKLFSQIKSLKEINDIWDYIPKNSIDYEVMEKTSHSYCMKSKLKWSDLGTWLSLYEHLKKDENNNAFKGQVFEYKSSNNLVLTNKTTAVIGLKNIAVINTDDATLVIDLNKSEDVKFIINKLDPKLK